MKTWTSSLLLLPSAVHQTCLQSTCVLASRIDVGSPPPPGPAPTPCLGDRQSPGPGGSSSMWRRPQRPRCPQPSPVWCFHSAPRARALRSHPDAQEPPLRPCPGLHVELLGGRSSAPTGSRDSHVSFIHFRVQKSVCVYPRAFCPLGPRAWPSRRDFAKTTARRWFHTFSRQVGRWPTGTSSGWPRLRWESPSPERGRLLSAGQRPGLLPRAAC